MYKSILLAVDGSNHSIRATQEAVIIASLVNGSKVDVIMVADYSKTKSEVLHSAGKEDLELTRRKRLFPIEELFKTNNINYEIHILHGEPGPTIVEYANKRSFDLVIIGSRGLNSFQEMVLGSVSHKVVKRVNCPVLVVK